MSINFFEGSERRPTAHRFYERAIEVFRELASCQDAGKLEQRRVLLNAHPEQRITVNSQRLKEIIPYIDFKCSPSSSIARNEAVQGSDIDGAVVITLGKQTLGQELAFVHELRKQGFDMYHGTEAEEAEKTLQEAQNRWEKISGSLETLGPIIELSRRNGRMNHQRVTFVTSQEMRGKIRKGELEMPVVIWLSGYSIL